MPVQDDTEFKGFVRTPNDGLDSLDPLDVGYVRDGVLNNLEALNQRYTQIRVNDMTQGGYKYGNYDKDTPLIPTDNARDYTLMKTYSFPLTVLKDGTLAPLWIRVAAIRDGIKPIVIWVMLRRKDNPAFLFGSLGKNMGKFSVDSSTPANYTLTSPSNSVLYIPRDSQGTPNLVPTKIRSSDSTTDGTSEVFECCLDLWIQVPTNATDTYGGTLLGVHAREVPFRTTTD